MLAVTAGEEAESWPRRAGPEHVAVALVDRAEHGVVAELEDAFAVDHGRELEQRVAVVHPQLLERRVDVGGRGEEAGVVRGVAVERPGEAAGAAGGQRGRGLRDEARVRVVDVAGAVALVEVAAEHDGADQHDEHRHGDREARVEREELTPAVLAHRLRRPLRRRACWRAVPAGVVEVGGSLVGGQAGGGRSLWSRAAVPVPWRARIGAPMAGRRAELGDQPRDAQREQPQAGDGQRRQA